MSRSKHAPPSRDSAPPRHVAAVIAETSQRLYAIQLEALNATLQEQTTRMRHWSQSAAMTSRLMAEWNQMSHSQANRLSQLTQDCLEITSQGIIEIQHLFGQSMVPGTEPETGQRSLPYLEKRDRNIVVSFPDRRIAAHQHHSAHIEENAPRQRRMG